MNTALLALPAAAFLSRVRPPGALPDRRAVPFASAVVDNGASHGQLASFMRMVAARFAVPQLCTMVRC